MLDKILDSSFQKSLKKVNSKEIKLFYFETNSLKQTSFLVYLFSLFKVIILYC